MDATINSLDNNYILNFNYNILSEESITSNNDLLSLIYYPKNDGIKIEHLNTLTNDLLNNGLNILYDSNNFNDYQRNIIERKTKDIVLIEDNLPKQFFEFEEEDKRLILK